MKNGRAGEKSSKGSDTPPRAAIHSSQEGSVESVGGGPAGSDRSDRSGGGTLPSDTAVEPEPGRDAFVSSEVTDKTSTSGKDPRTRS